MWGFIICYSCKRKCVETISTSIKQKLLTSFNDLGDKDKQDVYLQGLIRPKAVKKRTVENPKKQRNNNFTYEVSCSYKITYNKH